MKRVLVADDNKRITRALTTRLHAAGYETLTAYDGFTALKLALSERPDLILMDIWMPGMGLSVVERLNELGVRIPVIILTASEKSGLWAAAQEVGARAFVQKPYEGQELLRIVELTLSTNSLTATTESRQSQSFLKCI